MDDDQLCQNGRIQFGTIGYHNRFGTNLLRSQGATSSCPHKNWQREIKSYCSNPRLKGSIWDNQKKKKTNLAPFYMLKWITCWRSLRNYCWTTPYSKCKTKSWEIEIPSGRSGGKLFRSSQKSKFMTVWSWLTLMNRVINLSYELTILFFVISNMNPQVSCLWKLEPVVEFRQCHLWYNLLLNQLVH